MSNVKLGDESGIQVVDFAPFLDGTDKQGVADAILESFKDARFVYRVKLDLPGQRSLQKLDTLSVGHSIHVCTYAIELGRFLRNIALVVNHKKPTVNHEIVPIRIAERRSATSRHPKQGHQRRSAVLQRTQTGAPLHVVRP
ncbi:hypothetical protein BU17DRAFT_79791 [Hysterangium stoloniferum]|nr:hypothetical protein BU17DRAFT_79791 [Hysterangium stoloniferum]